MSVRVRIGGAAVRKNPRWVAVGLGFVGLGLVLQWALGLPAAASALGFIPAVVVLRLAPDRS